MHLSDEIQPAFARKQARVQRIGWALMGLVLLAALLGAFGNGPFAVREETSRTDDADVSLAYPTAARRQAEAYMAVTVHAPDVDGDVLAIAFSNDFPATVTISTSTPAEDAVLLSREGGGYAFQVEDWSEPLVVSFQYTPYRWGQFDGTVAVKAGDGPVQRLPVTHFVFP